MGTTVTVLLVVAVLAVVLNGVVSRVTQRLRAWLLDPRHMSKAERDVYFNREYAKRSALSSPPPGG